MKLASDLLPGILLCGFLASACTSNEPELGESQASVLVPPADGQFVAFQCGAGPAFDVADDGPGNKSVDIVGDATFPAILRAVDGTFLYLRMRLDGDPATSPTDLVAKSYGWLFDTDSDFTSFEFLSHLNGVNPESQTWNQNDTQSPPNDPSDGTRTLLITYTPTIDFWASRLTLDGSAFGGDPDFYLTIAIPISDLVASGISMTEPTGIWASTSNNNTNFGSDMNCAGIDPSLGGSATDLAPLDPNCLIDSDGDGVCDPIDVCPNDNPNDTDGDGVCDSDDACPLDDPNDTDGDGVCDSNDVCPLDNPNDSDGDGVCDSGDTCPGGIDTDDSDGDGVCDAVDVCPLDNPDDTDGDGVCDSNESCQGGDDSVDTDGDGICDFLDVCPLETTNDTDGDGVCDSVDTCPLDSNDDSDGDGVCDSDDACPLDIADDTDGDGVCDSDDPCPLDNPDDSDGDGVCDTTDVCLGGDDSADVDGDGVCDFDDNCVDVDNSTQVDTDNDGIGDACDTCPNDFYNDVDFDGLCAGDDNCPFIANSDQADADNDGIGDPCDDCEDGDDDGVCDEDDNCPGVPNMDQLDADDDDIGDACDECEDFDNDGVCQDDNCPDDSNADQSDIDGDGVGDLCDEDKDGDGVKDSTGVTGGGCSAGGQGGGGLALLLTLLALMGLSLRRRSRHTVLLATLALCMLWTTSAQAQAVIDRNFPVERFRLTPTDNGLFNVEWGKLPTHLAWNIGAWIGTADDPLVTYDVDDPNTRTGSLVGTRVGGAITAAMSVMERIAIAITVPVVLYQGGDSTIDGVTMDGALSSGGVGDVQLGGKVAITPHASDWGVAALATLSTPTASSEDNYLGEDSFVFKPEIAVSRRFGKLRAAINLGLHLRSRTKIGNLVVDDELSGQAGVGWAVHPDVELAATLSQGTSLEDPFSSANTNVLEGLIGGTYRLQSSSSMFLGLGTGLDEGFGSPDWRIVAGVRLSGDSPSAKKPLVVAVVTPPIPVPVISDRDGDGLVDAEDTCPDDAENINQYQDEDGCPDDADPDGDGVLGEADQCPVEPEDMDDFEDDDGCAEIDNDKDGLTDAADACPLKAGPPENVGCPDTDRDGDTVVDRLDNCPDEPGVVANHGCKKRQLVEITRTQLLLSGTVVFASNKHRIEKRSNRLLDNVAAVLVAHPEIDQVVVEGHTDDRGTEEGNLELSQKRAEAVVSYLALKGVEAGRLQATGFGESRPLADNKTASGRSMNRRVDFVIAREVVGTAAPGAQVPAYQPKPSAETSVDAPSNRDATGIEGKRPKAERQAKRDAALAAPKANTGSADSEKKRLRAEERAKRKAERAEAREKRAAALLEKRRLRKEANELRAAERAAAREARAAERAAAKAKRESE